MNPAQAKALSKILNFAVAAYETQNGPVQDLPLMLQMLPANESRPSQTRAGGPGPGVSASTKTGCPRCLAFGHLGDHEPQPDFVKLRFSGGAKFHRQSSTAESVPIVGKAPPVSVRGFLSLLQQPIARNDTSVGHQQTSSGIPAPLCPKARSVQSEGAKPIPPLQHAECPQPTAGGLPKITVPWRTLADRRNEH